MNQPAASTIVTTSSIIEENIDRNFGNLESHQLVWLAPQYRHNLVPIETLREIIDYTKLFEDTEACEEYIKNSNRIITFMIISDEISQEILSRIHNLTHVLGIYIHNENCVLTCPKIKLVSTDMNLLLMKLGEDVKTFLKQDRHILINNNNNNNSPSSSLEEEVTSGDVLAWWSPFLDLLLYHLPYPKTECLQKLTGTMKAYYMGNSPELRTLEEFESDYKAEDAIKWYTRETFVYRVLNKALRQRNKTLLFLFGFFIQDMYSKLKDEHQKFKIEHSFSDLIKVYRGQLMWIDEIQLIQNGYNKIVNWCFFSTTRDRPMACIYRNEFVQPEDRIQNVLFEIDIDCRKTSYPFADITHLSYFQSESEILFMIGTAFHVNDVDYNEIEKLWVIKLELEEDQRKITEDDCLPNINSNRFLLKKAVRALLQRFDSISTSDINIIFNQIFELFPTEKDWLMAVKFHCLANHEEHRYGSILNVFERGMDGYKKALTIWHEYVDDSELNCYLDIADIHREIAECYAHYSVKNYEQATFHCDLALKNYKLAQASVLMGNNEKTSIYEKLHDIYQLKMMIDDRSGIIEMALQNREDHVKHMLTFCHPNDVRIARSLEELAKLYKSVNKYDEAVINYEKAFEIYRNQTPTDQDVILLLAEEIADIYIERKNDPSSALKYQEIIRSSDSKEKLKFGHFMTAAKLQKERAGLNTNA